VYIPLEFDPGTDGQVDWSKALVIIASECVTVQMFIMRLCYSRRIFVRAFPAQKQEAFFEGHAHAFHHFQGVPQRISYDNLKAAVKRVLEGHNCFLKTVPVVLGLGADNVLFEQAWTKDIRVERTLFLSDFRPAET
jgi:transposase